MRNKILWEILVPTMMNGKPVMTKYHKVWDEKVRAISNGLTILKSAKGEWVSSSGELFAERMIPVRIAYTSIAAAILAYVSRDFSTYSSAANSNSFHF